MGPKRQAAKPAARRGRPPIHRESWTRVSVVLFDRQVAFLDRFARLVRRVNGATLTRAEIIRALVEALWRSRLDPPADASAEDLQLLLTERLSQRRPVVHLDTTKSGNRKL
jgi:hypothetical protein